MALQQHTPPSAFRASCFASWQLWVFEQPWNHSHQTELVCPFSQNRHQKHLYVTICSSKIGRIEVGSISKYLDWQNKAFLHSPKYDESTKLIDTTAGGVCWDAGQLICQHGNCHFQTLRTHPCRVDVNRVTGLAESKVNMGTVKIGKQHPHGVVWWQPIFATFESASCMTTDGQFEVAWFSLNVSRPLLSHPQTLKSSLASYSCTSGMWKKAKVKTWRNQENSENARCIQTCFKLYSRQTRDARI